MKVPYSPEGRIVVTTDPDFTESSRIMLQFMVWDSGAEEMFFLCQKSQPQKVTQLGVVHLVLSTISAKINKKQV